MAGLDPSIGLTGLRAAQRGLEVVGHNVANASTPGYTRQALELRAARPMTRVDAGQAGAGVDVVAVRRATDRLLEARLLDAGAAAGMEGAAARRLEELEAIVGRDGEAGLGGLLSRFAAGATGLAARPDDLTARAAFLGDARALASGLRGARAELDGVRSDIEAEVGAKLADVEARLREAAALDQAIVQAVAAGQQPNDLLDRRALALGEVVAATGARVASRPDGSVVVTAGSHLLLAGSVVRPLSARADPSGVQVIDPATGRPVGLAGGAIMGLLDAATEARDVVARVDALARAVIREANAAQGTGVPLTGPFTQVASTARVTDPAAPLGAAGLPFAPGATELVVNVTDLAVGTVTTTRLSFDPATGSLLDLATALDGVAGLTATAGADGLLRVVPAAGLGVDFADRTGGDSDGGHVLAALGVNPLFTGSSAADISVSGAVEADARAVAAGLSPGAGDGRTAARLAALVDGPLPSLGGASPIDHVAGLVAAAGEASRTHRALADGAEAALGAVQDRRASASGVSIDEEVAGMMRFQRAFQAAARWIQVVDQLSAELMDIGR